MHRRVRFALGVAAVVLASAGTTAQAQFFGNAFYPGGYGGYGWGGWGSTVGGDIARGLGYFAMGEGIYNRETAIAAAINANTLGQWNQYMYLSQLEANQRQYARMARRQQRVNMTGEKIYQRLRDNPTNSDITNGDALNVILDQITDPRIHSSALRLASNKLTGDLVGDIPFVHSSDAVSLSLHNLTAKDGWPAGLQGETFTPLRDAYRQAIDRALEEDKNGDISPESLQAVRDAASGLGEKLKINLPADPDQRREAQNFVKTLIGMSRMLGKPNVDKVIAELDKVKSTTLGSLLGFMHTFNLRFGPATTPRQRAIYEELYPMMASHRDRVLKESGLAENNPPKTQTPPPPASKRPTDFFQGMHLDHLEGTKGNNGGGANPQ